MNENIKKCKNSINNKMEFIPEGKETFEQFLNTIKEFGQIDSKFIEINNPWTTEKYHNNVFYYTLKENNYVAVKEKDNSYMHCIKSSYEFKKDKVYKLEFIVDYKGGDFDIGFADFSFTKNKSRLTVSSNSVTLSNEGLIINKVNINNNLKIEKGKKYEFIIDMKNKKFILNVNEVKSGEYDFDFQNNVFAQAAIRNLDNSIKIKTYEK